jgi:integrase/recombinase XerD
MFRLVESFFREHLQRGRGASRHTILTYRDALRLFFSFLADASGRAVADLRFDDLTAARVVEFLDHLETNRRNCPSTRNGRLAAIRSFVKHIIRNDPSLAGRCQRILSLPFKKTRQPVLGYLEPEELHLLLRRVDRRERRGVRDYALILFLYNTGARVSEALHVRPDDLQLHRPYQVRLHGKGNKDRLCPLWPETAIAVRRLLDRASPPDPSQSQGAAVFRNARGEPISRDGVAHILRIYLQRAAQQSPALGRKNVTPHTLRHSAAVAMLQAGCDLTVIRDMLGHESVATTNRYVKSNIQMKRRVLKAFWARSGLVRSRSRPWKPTPPLLAFLESL